MMMMKTPGNHIFVVVVFECTVGSLVAPRVLFHHLMERAADPVQLVIVALLLPARRKE